MHICDNPETNLLFHHYSLYVANVLQPLSHIENPYRSLYVPAALEGSVDVLFPAKNVAASVRLCIFHSLVATAAFHMSSCNPAQSGYHKTGILHRQKALRCMQLALAEGASQSSYRHLMVALCSLLTIGVMEGSIIDFQIHIQAMLDLRKSRQHWKIMSSETSRLNEMSSFMMLIANTTSCHLPSLPDFQILREEQCRPLSQTWCYEFTYGVTTDIAHLIEETIQLCKSLSFYDKLVPRQAIPENILEACESLGDRLLSWTLHENLASTIFPNDKIMQVMFCHHAHAWHLGTLIYYLQYIQGSTRSDITEQVAMIASNLHTVEDLKSGISDNQMAPITWPAFIASCSALDRETWVAWWTRMQRYGIGTMKRQFNVVQEVWSSLDADPATNWLEIIRKRKIEVLAL
ncbi:hypothetical protein N7526_005668 [Penicillium atrosanguineum]|nr:hypothetical protein N7526_005668 [Penicillium atrosanguineum]